MTLKDLLKDYFDNNSQDATDLMHTESIWGSVPWRETEYKTSDFEIFAKEQGISEPEFVKHYGGEDQGSTYYAVYKFTRGDETVFIKFYGYYASYDGVTYEGFEFVTPKEKTVVVYE